jgi:hypothetical protein
VALSSILEDIAAGVLVGRGHVNMLMYMFVEVA